MPKSSVELNQKAAGYMLAAANAAKREMAAKSSPSTAKSSPSTAKSSPSTAKSSPSTAGKKSNK